MSDRILVTGCRGQLGRDLVEHFSESYSVTGIDIEDLDLTDRTGTIDQIVRQEPSVVLHAAAYTNVDGAESDRERAMAVNGAASRNVAEACREVGARMVYYSTDYVFSGTKADTYSEDDQPDPLSVYGHSKLAGEREVADCLEDHVILRISWLYGRYGNNFIGTILRLARDKAAQKESGQEIEPLKVVNDQRGSPCWTKEVATQTQAVVDAKLTGLYHASAAGSCTWFDLASEVVAHAGLAVPVVPCATEEFPRPARRPANSVLDNSRLRKAGLDHMRDWKEALSDYLPTILTKSPSL